MDRKHWGQHGDECFGCKILSVQIDPRAMPTRRNNKPPSPPRYNTWENAIPTDSRGMPYLGPDNKPMTQKKVSEQRHRIEEQKKKAHQAPAHLQ